MRARSRWPSALALALVACLASPLRAEDPAPPTLASDADAAGLAKAIAWWDGLGLPDVGRLPFVRFTAGWRGSPEDHVDLWEYGFLMKEDATSFTVFSTALAERTHLRKPPKGEDPVRFERADLEKDVAKDLDALAKDDGPRGSFHESDVFGVGYDRPPWRFRGFLLARALQARGAKDLALRVWKHVAAESDAFQRQGAWSAFKLLQGDTSSRMMELWEQDVTEPTRTWTQALERYRRWRQRFDDGDYGAKDEAMLVKMAAEEAGYAEAAQAADKDVVERARRLVHGLPTSAPPREDARTPPESARSRLVAIGYPAVPALRAALTDTRFTKTLDVGFSFGRSRWRPSQKLLHVQDVALGALEEITQQDFTPKDQTGDFWGNVGARVDAWWQQLQTKGESSVLRDGVLAGNEASVAQARRLAQRFPGEAFEPIRKAIEGANERLAAALVATLAPLATPDVQAFLIARAKAGPLSVRMAAAETLHAQKSPDGLMSLLADLPALVKPEPISDDLPFPSNRDELIELLFRLTPARALARVRELLPELSAGLKMDVLGDVPKALGYWPSYTPTEAADRPQPPEVWKEAEALVVALVLDDGDRGGRFFVNMREQSNIVGEVAAEMAVEVWPKKYRYDPAASLEVRLAQRYALVNAWRKTQNLPPVTVPGAPPPIAAADPATAKALVDAWLAFRPGADRTAAEDAIAAQGLRLLPALKATRKSLKESDPRYAGLDLLVRRTASTLREVAWASDGPKPNDALKTLVDGMVGKPLAGREVLALLRQFAKDIPEGAHGIDLQIVRTGSGNGSVLSIRLTTETVSWRGGEGGWILKDSGLELVEGVDLLNRGSWWHGTRSPQLDEVLLVPEDEDVRLRRSIARVKN